VAVLGVLKGLVGRWRVQGHAHNEPITGTMDARAAVGGSWLIARETLIGPDGTALHEDLCLYGRDPLTGDLQVHHFQDGGVVSVHAVLPTDDNQGVHWVPQGAGPRVELRQLGDRWQVRVLALEATHAEVEVTYTATT
jgi:hypothetical protein